MTKPHRVRSVALVATVTALVLVFTPGVSHADTLPGAPGCTVLPADNVWHANVSNLPVDPELGHLHRQHRGLGAAASRLRGREVRR